MANFTVELQEIKFDCFGMTMTDNGEVYIGCTEGTTIRLTGLDGNELFMQLSRQGENGHLNLDNIYKVRYGDMYRVGSNKKYLFMTNFTYDTTKMHPIQRTQLFVKESVDRGDHVELKLVLRYYTKRTTIHVAYNKGDIDIRGIQSIWSIIQNAINTTKVTEDFYLDKTQHANKQSARKVYRTNEKVEKALRQLYGAEYGSILQAVREASFR